VVICLERGADCLHNVQLMPLPFQTQGSRGDGISIPIPTPYPRQTCPNPIVSCLIEIQTGFTFPVPAYPACAGKEAVKRVCSSSSIDIVDSFTAAYTETYSSRPRPQLPGSPSRNPGDWLRKSIGSDGRPSGREGDSDGVARDKPTAEQTDADNRALASDRFKTTRRRVALLTADERHSPPFPRAPPPTEPWR